MIESIIIVWLFCGFIGAGFDYAYFKGKYPSQHDTREAIGESLCTVFLGPINMILSFLNSRFGKYGWWELWSK